MWRNRFTTRNKVIGQLTTGALFFGMRSCEYLKVDGERKTKLLRVRNLRFYNNRKEIDKLKNTHLLFQASSVNITFESQKNGEKDESVTMHANQKELCHVLAWASITQRILTY